jgi:hypothetical protein
MNKRDDLPAVGTATAREDAQALVFVLQILCTVVLRKSTLSRPHSAHLSALASQLGEAASRVRDLGSATTPSTELLESIRSGIKLAKTALIELEPRAGRGSILVFCSGIRSAIANGIFILLRRPTTDPLVAVRAALAKLDWMQKRVDTFERQNSGEKLTSISAQDLSAATDPLRQRELEPEQSPQARIASSFE